VFLPQPFEFRAKFSLFLVFHGAGSL
jgi:hypothetical protein